MYMINDRCYMVIGLQKTNRVWRCHILFYLKHFRTVFCSGQIYFCGDQHSWQDSPRTEPSYIPIYIYIDIFITKDNLNDVWEYGVVNNVPRLSRQLTTSDYNSICYLVSIQIAPSFFHVLSAEDQLLSLCVYCSYLMVSVICYWARVTLIRMID